MFITRNLERCNFRPFLNGYLKSLGYQRIVFYSGAKNEGKFVLDDQSAILTINSNRASRQNNNSTGTDTGAKPRKRRIMNPRADAAGVQRTTASQSQPSTEAQPASAQPAPQKLIYRQPKLTPVEFLDEAKKMMSDSTCKSAVVFTFFQDFVTDRSAPMQPYLELISHLWDEYSRDVNENICIFLAPDMSEQDLSMMFDRMENGFVFKNRFFNDNGTINRRSAIGIGLPGRDEIGSLLEYLRIIGVDGKRIEFRPFHKKKMVSSLLYLSREADQDENRSGYLYAIFNNLTGYMRRSPDDVVRIDEKVIESLYSRYKNKDDEDPLKKLETTKGWEAAAKRIDEIVEDFRIKKKNASLNASAVNGISQTSDYGNDRIDPETNQSGFKYPVPQFVIKGNPGVGKTTVARLIGQIFYNEGILKEGTTIEVKRDDLVDQYIGGTAIKTMNCIERAQESVLFIDDAYSLIEKGDDHNYSKEAIDTIVPAMTNPDKYRFCLIMAGYPEPMDELLDMNSGLKSRFGEANILTIEDYKPDLLKEIFVNNCKKDGYSFTDEVSSELGLFFTNLYDQRNRADFGNARDIVAIAKEVKMRSSLRDDQARIISKEDFSDEMQKYFIKQGVSSVDEIYSQIDKYVGMGFVKELFENLRLEILDNQDSIKRGIKPEEYPDHYIFAGNPGTGKTTVGKMIGHFYHVMGVLGGDETLFVDASEIIGNHVGDSKDKITQIMQKAIDHNQVLYIDEAYQISESAYGNEIIGAMMTKMTENAADFKVIFGMYKNKVEDFLKMNAGLSRRLRIVEFPDYTPDQLTEIFDRSVKAQGCTITDEARNRIKLVLTYKYDVRGDDFGNAGEVKKLVQDMKKLRLRRTYGSNDPEVDRYQYTIEDIPEDLLKKTEDMVNPKSLDDIMAELNEQIGMSDLKDIIIQKQEDIVYAKKSGGSLDDIRPGYYFFVGNPGTGKSTSAKLFAECLHQLGVVKTANFYSCTAKDLIGQYVGETAGKANVLLQKSKNSVLFIDEAYSLSYADDHSGNSYKKEAVEELIAYMDQPEHRKNSCIILAGYEKDMQGLYKSNSGMRSRIEEVHFRDYSADECYQIFALFCRKAGFEIEEGVKDIYVPVFEKLKTLEFFSNGRTARTIYEKTAERLKRRVARSDDITGDAVKLITKDDLLSVDEAVAEIGVDGR